MTPLVLAGSVAAILTLAGIAWALARRRGGRIESPEAAADAADAALPGFVTANAVVGADGLGALAVSDDGRVAVMKRRGARITTREVPWSAVRSTMRGIVVETSERRFGRVALTGVSVLDIRRLAPRPARV